MIRLSEHILSHEDRHCDIFLSEQELPSAQREMPDRSFLPEILRKSNPELLFDLILDRIFRAIECGSDLDESALQTAQEIEVIPIDDLLRSPHLREAQGVIDHLISGFSRFNAFAFPLFWGLLLSRFFCHL